MRKAYADGAIPPAGTNMRFVLDCVADAEECTLDDIHAQLDDDMAPAVVTRTTHNLVMRGLLDRNDKLIRLSAVTRHALMTERKLINADNIVPPPDRNVFGPELKPSNYMRTTGTREGSNEHLTWSSKHV